MKFTPNDPPRGFAVGNSPNKIVITDCGTVRLDPDEQVTFVTARGAEYDVARKDWGFYATPSLNGRLERFGLRAVLVCNRATGRYFLLLVERGEEPRLNNYMAQEGLEVVAWLDSTAALEELARRMGNRV